MNAPTLTHLVGNKSGNEKSLQLIINCKQLIILFSKQKVY